MLIRSWLSAASWSTMTTLLCWVIVHHKKKVYLPRELLSYFHTGLKPQHNYLQWKTQIQIWGLKHNVLRVDACPIITWEKVSCSTFQLLLFYRGYTRVALSSCASESHCSMKHKTCFVITKMINLVNDSLYVVLYCRYVFDTQIIYKRCPLQNI